MVVQKSLREGGQEEGGDLAKEEEDEDEVQLQLEDEDAVNTARAGTDRTGDSKITF